MVEEILDEIKKGASASSYFKELFSDQNSASKENAARKPLPRGKLPDKEFVARNSLLTDLIEVKHIRSIYNLHIVGVIIMFLNCFIHDFVDSGRYYFF